MESNGRKQFSAVVVIEGQNDTKRLRQSFPGIEAVETSGSEIFNQTLAEIKRLVKTGEITIFTDPDYNGERIGRLAINAAPNARQVSTTRKEGGPTKRGSNLEAEHASREALVRALGDLYEIQVAESDITKKKHDDLSLAVNPEVRLLREKVGIKLGIEYGSSRWLLKRLRMFGITYDELKRVAEDVE